ncbi:hypothetical protein HNR39_003661 [Glaciimonas immobilis]|uniref:Uncharacterized protein n=1 Tax=Glaciimonas immobilis TaxID=728004 RepID=A0A840RW30_9BURK|nr:hypothetical protein [Glaciimonas immobilis]
MLDGERVAGDVESALEPGKEIDAAFFALLIADTE